MVLQIFLCFLANTTFAADTTPLLERKHQVSFDQIVSGSDLLEQVKHLQELNQEKEKITERLDLLSDTRGVDEKKAEVLHNNLTTNKHQVNKELSEKELKLDQSIFNYIYNDSKKTAERKAKIFNDLDKKIEEHTTTTADVQESCCCICYFWSGRRKAEKPLYDKSQSQLVIQKALYALELSEKNS